MKEIQGMLFFFLLLYASFKDIKSREVSNFVPICIFLIGFLDISFQEVPLKLLAALLITLPQLIVAIHGTELIVNEKQAVRFRADIPHEYNNPFENCCTVYNTIFYPNN